MDSLGNILAAMREKSTGKYLAHEWQLYGYRLAVFLDDEKRISMYMKLAKEENRQMLQNAWDFVKESNARSKPRLFLWKLTQLRKERELKEKSK